MVAAVMMGGASQMALQWVWSYRCGVPLAPERPDLEDPDLKRMLKLFLPYAAGLSLNQLNPVSSIATHHSTTSTMPRIGKQPPRRGRGSFAYQPRRTVWA